MKIKITGEMTVARLRQCLFEQLLEMEDSFAIRHGRNITLYFTPTNGFGDEVYCVDDCGREVSTIHVKGPYQAAADQLEI